MTTYIVLVQVKAPQGNSTYESDVPLYRLVGTYNASGPNQAIRSLAGDSEGTYIAVPERNWTEVRAELEQPAPRMRLAEQRSDLPAPGEIPGQETLPDGDSDISMNEGSIAAGEGE